MTRLAWFVRNVIGAPGLPPLLVPFADLALMLLMLAGALWCWRTGRRPLAIVCLALLGAYPLMIAVGSLFIPTVGNRLFLPILPAAAILAGCALDRVSRVRAGWVVAVAAIGLMGWSSLAEHRVRTKYENVPAALAFADAAGLGLATPIVACNLFTANTVWTVDPRRRVYYPSRDGGLLRFDGEAFRMTRMPLPRAERSRAADVSRFLGAERHPVLGLRDLHATSIVAIMQPCRAEYAQRLVRPMMRLGYAPVVTRAFPQTGAGRIVMERGETVLTIFTRRPSPTGAAPL